VWAISFSLDCLTSEPQILQFQNTRASVRRNFESTKTCGVHRVLDAAENIDDA
jgi:hypothetical protein